MTWTGQTFTVGQILTAAQMNNLQADITAMANGDAGAPKIQTAAIDDAAVTTAKIADGDVTSAKLASGSNERNWILGLIAGAGVGGVGTYALMYDTVGGERGPGSTLAGRKLDYSSAGNDKSVSSPAGTWLCMGNSSVNAGDNRVTLWLRIA